MAGEKRKAGAAEGERPPKKAQTGTIKVTHLHGPDVAKPLIANDFSNFARCETSPDISFTGFSRKEANGRSSLLLHSSDHPTIDYVATESSTTDAAEKHVKHYIAVFNPASNELKVMEAKKMTVRSIVRTPDEEGDEEQDEGGGTIPSSRAALTQAFGTKKSKRAVASMAENRLLARDGENPENPVSAAILSSIKEDDDDQGDSAALRDSGTSARVNKPLPPANPTAPDITKVYDLSSLIFPAPYQTTLSAMPIAFWKDRVAKDKPISAGQRFVATRVGYLISKHLKDPSNTDAIQKVQILRYIQLLAEIHKYASHLNTRKPMAPVEKWPNMTTTDSSLSTAFKAKLVAHFFPNNTPTVFNKTLLTSTILALTLHIPPPNFTPGETPAYLFTEPSEISLDLAIPPTETNKLYRELGCKFESMPDGELRKYGWEKIAPQKKVDESGKTVKLPKPKFAKLRFPVEFPKISAGRPGRR